MKDFSLENKYAVITGASGGLGRSYAIELAKRGINIILIALPDKGLENIAQDISKSGVKCVCLGADLLNEVEMLALTQKLAAYNIAILINNVGIGGSCSFCETDFSKIQNIIHLNIGVTTKLIHNILPIMIKNGGGYILNVASMAAMTASGWKSVYPASKRYILDLSRGLHYELKHQNIQVSVVLPGPMKTNADICKRIDKQGFFGRITVQRPEFVTRRSINAMLRGKCVIVPGIKNKIYKFLLDIVPKSFTIPLVSKITSREVLTNR